MVVKSIKANWEGELPHQWPSVWPTTASAQVRKVTKGMADEELTIASQAELNDEEQGQDDVDNRQLAKASQIHGSGSIVCCSDKS